MKIRGIILATHYDRNVLKIDIERIDKDCTALMELIHKKAFGILHGFLTSSRLSGTKEWDKSQKNLPGFQKKDERGVGTKMHWFTV